MKSIQLFKLLNGLTALHILALIDHFQGQPVLTKNFDKIIRKYLHRLN
jgi:hypothetical protein